MEGLPKVLMTDVVRSTHQGDSHGGAYLVDLETGTHERVLNWNTAEISWKGRGADRGLRGIAFHGDEIFIAASDEVFVFDRGFGIVRSHRNPFLSHCHEIWLEDGTLYLTSTGYDSVLEMDIATGRFVAGWWLDADMRRGESLSMSLRRFDPENPDGVVPERRDVLHINSVSRHDGMTLFSGVRLPGLMAIRDGRLGRFAQIRPGSHNAQAFGDDGVIYNATGHDALVIADAKGFDRRILRFPRYPEGELLNADLPEDHARQGFGRGLCFRDGLIIVGSSPATVSVYEAETGRMIRSVNITMDVRHCPHGLEIWPF